MELILGMAGALLAASIFGIGVCIGCLIRGAKHEDGIAAYEDPRTAEEIQKERQRLIAEQEAFRQQMEYNADMAYGLGRAWDQGGSET